MGKTSQTAEKKRADKGEKADKPSAEPKVSKKGNIKPATAAATGPAKENKKRKKSEPFQVGVTRVLKGMREAHKKSKNVKLLFRPEVVAAFRDLQEAIAIHLASSATEYNKNHLRRKNLSKTAVATVLAANLPNKKLFNYCLEAGAIAEQKRVEYKAEHAEENKAKYAARMANPKGGSSKPPKVSRPVGAKAQ